MFIGFILFICALFSNNISSFTFFNLVILNLIYFCYTKNLFSIFESNICLEDRLIILSENIIKSEYNLISLCFIFIFLWVNFNKNFNMNFLVSLLYLYWGLNLAENLFHFQDFFFKYFYEFNLNTKLLNGLFLIHPFLIYFFFSLIFLCLSILRLDMYKRIFFKNFFYNFWFIRNFKLLNTLMSLSGIAAITLGAWWAYQEINWNGWWSWDLIELINLILILFILSFIHKPNLMFSSKQFIFIFKFILYTLLLFLIISRFGIINSLHSFINLTKFEQFSFNFLNYFIFYCLFIGFWLLFVFNIAGKSTIANSHSNSRFFGKFSLFFCVLGCAYLVFIYAELGFFIFNKGSLFEQLYTMQNFNYLLYLYLSVSVLKLLALSVKVVTLFSLLGYWLVFIEFIILFSTLALIFSKRGRSAFILLHIFVYYFIIKQFLSNDCIDTTFNLRDSLIQENLVNYKLNGIFLNYQLNYLLGFINNTINIFNQKITITYFFYQTLNSFIGQSATTLLSLSNFFFNSANLFVFIDKYTVVYCLNLAGFYYLYCFLNFFIFSFFYNKQISKRYVNVTY